MYANLSLGCTTVIYVSGVLGETTVYHFLTSSFANSFNASTFENTTGPLISFIGTIGLILDILYKSEEIYGFV